MVWGMSFPSSFGDYWPRGKNEGEGTERAADGWEHRLREHFVNSTPEEQARLYPLGGVSAASAAWSYPFYAMMKFQKEPGSKYTPDEPPLIPIEPHEPLQFFQMERGSKNLGSMIALNAGVFAVDETVKDIIERLEPGVHQFFPVEIRMPRGKIYPVQYFVLVIGQYLDSFDPESSDECSWERTELGNVRYDDSKAGITGLAFKKSVFGNAHLWRERRINGALTSFSDQLIAEIQKRELRIPKHFQMSEA